MKIILILITLYIAYYTVSYAYYIWTKEKNYFASIFVGLMALSLVGLSLLVRIK